MVWKFAQVRVIEGQFVPWEPKLVRVIGSFEKSRVQSKRLKVWFEISGGSGNRGFEKSGFHCINFLNSLPLPKLMTALSLQATEDDNVQTEVFNCEGLT